MTSVLPSGFLASDMAAVVEQSAGEGLDSGIAPWARFLSGVVKGLFARRTHPSGADDSSAPCIFFLGEPPTSLGVFAPKYTFAQGVLAMNGHVWFMNEEARRGAGQAHGKDAEELLELATNHPDLSHLPTLLYVPDAVDSPIMFFRSGLSKPKLRSDYNFVTAVSTTPEHINAAIDKLHKDVLETPNGEFGSFNAWQDGENWIPIPDTEREIQAQVRATLVNAAPGIHATEEDMGKSGRHDIGLVSLVDGDRKYHGILELKVLKKGRPVAKPIQDGIGQAYNYAQDAESPWAELCVFDFRDSPPETDIFANYRNEANDLGVLLERWFLFSTLKRFRAYRTAKRLAEKRT